MGQLLARGSAFALILTFHQKRQKDCIDYVILAPSFVTLLEHNHSDDSGALPNPSLCRIGKKWKNRLDSMAETVLEWVINGSR